MRQRLAALFLCAVTSFALHAQEALRPEVAKPLQAARDLIKAGKHKEALNKLREVDAINNRNPNENFVLEQMRASAAMQAGQNEIAIRALEALLASGRGTDAEQARNATALAGLYYRANNYPQASLWAQRALKSNPNDSAMRQLLTQARFLSGDTAAAAKDASAEVQAAEQAGQRPPEEKLQLLANIYARNNADRANYLAVLEKLATYYPKPEYWRDLLRRLETKPGFAPRLALDLYRLRSATKTIERSEDYVEMAQLALQEQQAIEAQQVIDQGYANKQLGSGNDAERHQRLKLLAARRAAERTQELPTIEPNSAKDGNALVSAALTYSSLGQHEKAIALMQAAFAKGGLKRSDDAHLHFGIVYLRAGQRAKALQEFKAVSGSGANDGAADLARLWAKLPA